jgi:hypothetical protein
MTFVRTIGDIEANVVTLLDEIHAETSATGDAAKLVGIGRVFLPVNYRGFIAFAPSKFIGYKGNRVALHMRNRATRDGKDTNRELNRFLGRPVADPEMERRLVGYCEKIGVRLGDHKHSFWRVSSSIQIKGAPNSAIDDLDQTDIGNDSPEYRQLMTRVYERDDRVRQCVLNRAAGRCEYDNCIPFTSKKSVPYLEAHHVVHLSAGGKDRTDNVIALCASHHREAHFGEKWASLNEEFLKILSKIGS